MLLSMNAVCGTWHTVQLALADEDSLACQLLLSRGSPARAAQGIELRRRREVDRCSASGPSSPPGWSDRADSGPSCGADMVAIEVGGTLLELGEVLNRAQGPLRAVDLLIEHAAQAVVSSRKRAACGRTSGVRWKAALVWKFEWQSRQVTPRLGSATLRSSVWLNSSCGKGVSSSRRPSTCTGVRSADHQRVVVLDGQHLPCETSPSSG